MLPRWHAILGLIFTILIWIIVPTTNFIYLFLVFISSLLIDFDHYINAAIKTNSLGIRRAFEYYDEFTIRFLKLHKKGIRKQGDFHLFHTIEFHLVIAAIGLFYTPFLFIFIGMVFHSLIDLIYLYHKDMIYLREFFFSRWAVRKIYDFM